MPLPAFRSRARRFTKSSSITARRAAAPAVEALEDRSVPSATMLTQLDLATAGTNFTGAVAYKNAQYFPTLDTRTGSAGLYKSDGTAAGTTLVSQVIEGGNSQPTPSDMTIAGGMLYYLLDNQLWVSDGTAAGTTLLTSYALSAGNSGSSALAIANGTVYFIGYDAQVPYTPTLWRTAPPPVPPRSTPPLSATGDSSRSAT
jgi:ELWxxDGT repeat protein